METQPVIEEPQEIWFTLSTDEVEKKLDTNITTGLSTADANARLEKYGPNELQAEEKKPRWKVFLEQFRDVLIYILIFAAIFSAVMEYVESSADPDREPTLGWDWLVIAIIVILNAIIGFIQEGMMRKHYFVHGKLHDLFQHSIFKDQFEKIVNRGI